MDESLNLAAGLLDGWKQNQPPAGEFSLRSGVHTGQFACVYGISAHAHRLTRATVTLYHENMYLESFPTIRSAYEHALTSMWVAQYPPAAQALVNESYRNRKNALTSAAKAGWTTLSEDSGESADWGPIASPLDKTAKHMESLCNALTPGGAEAYAIYRTLSSLSHAGAQVVDFYIHDEPMSVQSTPKDLENPEVWLLISCAALVWSGRAVDMLTKEHSRRNELRAAAKKLGISTELKRSYLQLTP